MKFLLLANWLLTSGLFLNLFGNRSVYPRVLGRYSTGYAVFLIVAALVFAAVSQATVIVWRVGRDSRIALSKSSARLDGAGLVVAIVSALLLVHLLALGWWLHRPWQLRLFTADVVLAAALLWLARVEHASGAGAADRSREIGSRYEAVHRALVISGVLLLVLGLEEIAFAGAGFDIAIGWLAALVALPLIFVAGRGGSLRQARALTAILATVVALGVGEVGARALGIGAVRATFDNRTLIQAFHHNPIPRSTFEWRPHRLDDIPPVLIETNSLGMRGPEVAGETADVLIIGDSFVQALQLPWEKTVAPRFEQSLVRRGMRARAISHGVVGWSPLLEWNWYLKVGRRFHPRLVALFFFWNDLWTRGDEATTYGAVMSEDGRPHHFDVRLGPSWLWSRHVRVLDLARDVSQRLGEVRVRRLFSAEFRTLWAANDGQPLALADARRAAIELTGDEPVLTRDEIDRLISVPGDQLDGRLRRLAASKFWPSFRPLSLWSDAQVQAAATSERVLQRFAEDVRADGARLLLVYVPNPLQVAPSECSIGRYFDQIDDRMVLPSASGIQEWLARVTRQHDIGFLDPTAAMRARDAETHAPPLYVRYDCHWSAEGHELMAEYLADWCADDPDRCTRTGSR